MLMSEYIEVETKSEVKKPITQVHFDADYDVTEILTQWGNWSRRELYLKQNTPSYYNSQPKKEKSVCSDNDALIIDGIMVALSRINISTAKDQKKVLELFYFGQKEIFVDYIPTTGIARECREKHIKGQFHMTNAKDFTKNEIYLVSKKTVVDIAKLMGIDRAKVKALKEAGENHITGHLASLTLQTGLELDILKNIRLFR